MDTYWMLEYGKVLGGYIFLMFIWPSVVFWKYLRGKTKRYWFSFCVTVQIVIVNMIILTMGLANILNVRTVLYVFYGIFLIAIWRMEIMKQLVFILLSENTKKYQLFQNLKMQVSKKVHNYWKNIRLGMWEYLILFIVISFAMLYFSHDAFTIHSYGHFDTFTHHGWINDMARGKIFSDGIYPQAMHCFVFCLHALFGIRIYSILLFLQCIHVTVFLLSAYCLLREIFHWIYSPIFVLGLYLTLDFIFEYSMHRLQSTIPMEFGLHTEFLCALYLLRYLKSEKSIFHDKIDFIKNWDENLFLLLMSLAASIATHYYTTIMAFVLCVSFVPFYIKRIIRFKYLIPLIISVSLGCAIAILPMAGALAKGIPFEGSIYWGVNSIKGTSSSSVNNTESSENVVETLPLTPEDTEVIEKTNGIIQKLLKNVIKAEYLIKAVYKEGYQGMYWEKRGRRIFEVTLMIIIVYIVSRKKGFVHIRTISNRYLPIILASLLSMLIFAAYDAPDLRLPVLIPDHRICTTGHMVVLAVMVMPADIIFSIVAHFIQYNSLRVISIISTVCIYLFTNIYGVYHDFLYYRLMRYDSAAKVTSSIIEEFPQDSYTIVSPIEDSYQVDLYGTHEEISAFLRNCNSRNYILPSKYVFIYVEKKPFVYFQYYYFNGPFWLGKKNNYEMKVTEISKESAKKELTSDVSTRNAGREIIESKAYEWCQHFSDLYPSEMNIYYEDDEFVCYYFKQDIGTPYNLNLGIF